jgi:hypothetical protein
MTMRAARAAVASHLEGKDMLNWEDMLNCEDMGQSGFEGGQI